MGQGALTPYSPQTEPLAPSAPGSPDKPNNDLLSNEIVAQQKDPIQSPVCAKDIR